jgi:hypothetical protein
MKNVFRLARLHVVALALAGLPLLTLSTLASAQDSATVSSSKFNPPPCDYSDTFYEDNGVIPSQVVGRFGTARRTGPPARGNGVNWVADSTCAANDPERRNFRILATTGGFTDNGTNAPNAFISILGFLTNESAFETTYTRLAGTHDVSISNSENPRGISMETIVGNFEAYAMVKQRLPNGVFATNPCASIASPLAPPTPCFQVNTVNTIFTPNLRQDWRFASNRNAIDGSDGKCISTDPTVCDTPNDSPFGYFCDDLLGMWIITYVWLTQDPAHPTTAICAQVFAALEAKNGTSLDGGPIIVTPDDTNNQLEANGCAAEGNLDPMGGDGGAIWLVCPAIPDPRNGAIARDAFLDQVFLPNGQPQNRTMTANFVSLQTTGQFPGGGDGSVPGSP